MTTCILTVIKDEHLYLKEWIQYHLHLGIDTIFILEDVNSQSHQSITQNYGGRVILTPAFSLLTPAEQEQILSNRAQHKPGGQKTYIQAGLKYLQQHYNYDWCFVIDNDEFLTLESQATLASVITNYASYDAVILSWKCYGASGLITTPNYNRGATVLNTFTTPIQGHVPASSVEHNKKTCYNLHTYQPDFWWNIHVPSDQCHYCNTQYQADKRTICYDHLYIRHYITKSWAEYYWKKTTRGYFFGIVRTLDAFFIMNPELLPLKNALLAPTTLVVLPYSSRGSQGDELRLALSGWKQFCQFNYHFVVIGDVNAELQQQFPWIDFIYTEPAPRLPGQYNPHIDMQHKMELAYNLFYHQYDGFIWMVDDNYAIRPFTLSDIVQPYYRDLSFTGREQDPTWFWKHDKWKTRQLLDAYTLPHINYTTHFPCYFKFTWLKEIWDKYDMRNNSYVVEDIYFNSHPITKPLPANSIRYGIWGLKQMADLDTALTNPSIKFLCNSVEGWSEELERQLDQIINHPS